MPHSSQQHAIRLFIRRLEGHSGLSDQDRQTLEGLPGSLVNMPAQCDFVHLGQPVDHVSLIVDGLVARFSQTEDGKRQILALGVPGDIADLSTAFLPAKISGLQALTRTTIFRIAHSRLREIAAGSRSLLEAFYRDCLADAAIGNQWLLNIGRRDSRSRIAHLLCETSMRYRRARQDHGFALPLTQLHLADALGLTPVHINRTLQTLRNAQLLRLGRGFVEILDWDMLAEIAEFNPSYLNDFAARMPAPAMC